jgi:ABC-type multidrug transport system ATPase subunit
MQTSMGFVAQEDILLGSLTPMEVLEFVSRLRQPNGITDDQRRAKILALLKSMGLEHVKDSLIGFTGSAAANSGIKRGLSGL